MPLPPWRLKSGWYVAPFFWWSLAMKSRIKTGSLMVVGGVCVTSVHVKPTSTLQSDEHPSKLTVLPSSHSSVA